MKPALLTLSFLLLAFPLAFSNDAQQVLDEDGKPVVPGADYFIVPIILGPKHPGAVTLGNTGNSLKYPTTVEVNSDERYGQSVRFSIPEAGDGTEILTDTPVVIKFTKKPECADSSKWRIFVNSEIEQAYVGIGGPQDHPGQQTVLGRFSIIKSDPGYSLVFCQPFTVGGSPLCSNVGRYRLEEPRSLLVLTGNGSSFQFGLRRGYTSSGIRTVV